MTPDSILRIGLHTDARYRTVDEHRIIEQLLQFGFAFEMNAGQGATAMRDAAAALQRWVDLGLGFAAGTEGARRFDPAEVMNFAREAGQAGRDRFWADRMVATSRRGVLAFHGNVAGDTIPSPQTLPPRSFHVTLRRDFDLARQPAGTRLLLRLPLPLEDDALTDLRVVPLAPPGVTADFKMAPGRLDIRMPSTATKTQLGFDATFNARPHTGRAGAPRLSSADVALYTRGKEGLVQVTPRVQALAAKLAYGALDAASCVHAFWNHLLDMSHCGVLHYDELIGRDATDWALDSTWMDCHLASALFVALCRASAIPARLVSGYLLYGTNTSYHYWAEVWLQPSGWQPYDFMSSDLSLRGRDVVWRDCFAGKVDYRMKTQCLPRSFNYNPAMPFPDMWHMQSRLEDGATENAFYATATGELLYRDTLWVRDGPAA